MNCWSWSLLMYTIAFPSLANLHPPYLISPTIISNTYTAVFARPFHPPVHRSILLLSGRCPILYDHHPPYPRLIVHCCILYPYSSPLYLYLLIAHELSCCVYAFTFLDVERHLVIVFYTTYGLSLLGAGLFFCFYSLGTGSGGPGCRSLCSALLAFLVVVRCLW